MVIWLPVRFEKTKPNEANIIVMSNTKGVEKGHQGDG